MTKQEQEYYSIYEQAYQKCREKVLQDLTGRFAEITISGKGAISKEEDDYRNDKNFLYECMEVLFLTELVLLNDDKYTDELYKTADRIIPQIGYLTKKAYDKVILAHILLQKGAYFFEKDINKEYKVIFRKISDVGSIVRWTLHFVQIAYNEQDYHISNFLIETAMTELDNHGCLSEEVADQLKKYYVNLQQ